MNSKVVKKLRKLAHKVCEDKSIDYRLAYKALKKMYKEGMIVLILLLLLSSCNEIDPEIRNVCLNGCHVKSERLPN